MCPSNIVKTSPSKVVTALKRDATIAIERARFATRPPMLVEGMAGGVAAFNRTVRDAMLEIWKTLPVEPTMLRAKARIALGDAGGARRDLEAVKALDVDNEETKALWAQLPDRNLEPSNQRTVHINEASLLIAAPK